jgi:hypothetical protein
MKARHTRLGILGVISLVIPALAWSDSAFISGAYIVKVEHDLSNVRGPNGRGYIYLDRTFPVPGVCSYGGGLNQPGGWYLEFSAEHGSFRPLFTLAITAYASGRSIRVDYDDGFGSGTSCRITSLRIED